MSQMKLAKQVDDIGAALAGIATTLTTMAKHREGIRESIQEIESAPITRAETEENARLIVKKLADQWDYLAPMDGINSIDVRYFDQALAEFATRHPLELLAAAAPEQMTALLMKKADKVAKVALPPVSRAERRQKLAELNATIKEIEQQACAIIWRALDAGIALDISEWGDLPPNLFLGMEGG